MKRVVEFFTVLAAIGMMIYPSLVKASEVTEQVKMTIDEIIEIINDPSLKGPDKKEDRRDKIREKIQKRFNFEEMAQRALGKHWRKRSDEEKKEFVKLFGRLIENSYIGKMERYTDEKVLYGKEIMKKKASEVRTKIITKKGTEVPINYRLLKREGEWMIYDVIIEGISLVRNYRTQFSKVLRLSPFEELIKQLKEKTEVQIQP
jgi:phospholipid transport system substrate-binding protein